MGYLKYKILSYNQCQNNSCHLQSLKNNFDLGTSSSFDHDFTQMGHNIESTILGISPPSSHSQGLDFQKHVVTNFKFFRTLIFVNIKLGYSLALCILFLTNFKIYCILAIISFTPFILEIGVEIEKGVKYSYPYKACNGLVLMEECQFPLYTNSNFQVHCGWPTHILNISSKVQLVLSMCASIFRW